MLRFKLCMVLLAALLLAVAATAQADYANTVLGDSPLGYWRLGETGETDALDSSGNSRDGTAVGNATLGSAASSLITDPANLSATFDGLAISHVDIGANSAPFDFGVDDPFSLEAWAKYEGTTLGTVMSKYFMDVTNIGYRLLLIPDLGMVFQGMADFDGTTGGYIMQYGGTEALDGEWHHLVATKAAGTSTDTMKLYLDGALVTSTPGSSGTMDFGISTPDPVRIGTSYHLDHSQGFAFVGSIDEAAIYSGVLDATQVAAHYAAGGGSEPIPGDLDDDGFVGGSDLDIIRSFWGQEVTPGNKLHGDPSGDGLVAGDDLDEVRAHWGEGTPPAAGVVPEPSALILLASGVVGLLLARRRR